MEEFHISVGSTSDLDILVRHRMKMWESMFPEKREQIEGSKEETARWISGVLGREILIPFIARAKGGRVAGSGCLLIKEDQPRPWSSQIYNPYLLSMYTEEEFRGMGVATEIVRHSIEWSKEHGYDRIVLHASRMGRSIYEKFGFEQTNEMRIWL